MQQVWHAGLPSPADKALRETARLPKLLVQCEGHNSDIRKVKGGLAQAPKVPVATDLRYIMMLYAQVECGS